MRWLDEAVLKKCCDTRFEHTEHAKCHKCQKRYGVPLNAIAIANSAPCSDCSGLKFIINHQIKEDEWYIVPAEKDFETRDFTMPTWDEAVVRAYLKHKDAMDKLKD